MKKYVAIGRNIGVSYLSFFLVFLANPLLVVMLTRFLPVADYGVFSLLQVTISVGAVLLNIGFTDYIQAKLPGTEKRHRIGVFFTLFFLQAGLVFALVALLLIPQVRGLALGLLRLHGMLPEFLLAVGIILIVSLLRLFHAYLFAQKRIVLYNLFITFQQVSWIIALGIWVLGVHALTLRTVMVIYCLGIAATGLLGGGMLWRDLLKFLRMGFQSHCIRHALLFGLPLLAMTVSSWAMEIGDRYVINYFLGKEQVALYSLAYSLLGVALNISIVLPITLYPYLAEAWNRRAKYHTFFNMAVKYTLLVLIPSFFGFIVMRKEIITLVSGQAYLPAAGIIPVLAFFIPFAALNYLLNQLLLLRERTGLLAGIYLCGGVLNTVLNFVLIPRIGIVGAAWATVISFALVFLLLLWNMRKDIAVDFGFIRFFRMLVAGLLMAGALLFVTPHVFWTKLLAIAAGAALYGALVLLFRVFDKKEFAVAKSLLRLPAWFG